MANTNDPVAVQILDKEFRISCTPGERDALVDAAAELDRRMREARQQGPTLTFDKIAVMTALNLSGELLRLQREAEARADSVDAPIQALADKLDRALDGNGKGNVD